MEFCGSMLPILKTRHVRYVCIWRVFEPLKWNVWEKLPCSRFSVDEGKRRQTPTFTLWLGFISHAVSFSDSSPSHHVTRFPEVSKLHHSPLPAVIAACVAWWVTSVPDLVGFVSICCAVQGSVVQCSSCLHKQSTICFLFIPARVRCFKTKRIHGNVAYMYACLVVEVCLMHWWTISGRSLWDHGEWGVKTSAVSGRVYGPTVEIYQ